MRSRSAIIITLSAIAASTICHAKVDITKDRDSHIKVWNTIFGFRLGDPIYEGDLPAGHRLVVTEAWWATDTSIEQTFLGLGSQAVFNFAPIVPDHSNPGLLTMAEKLPWLAEHFGSERKVFVDVSSPFGNIFVAVDMTEALLSGAPPLPPGVVVNAFGGRVPELPGYQFGFVEQPFDPVFGWFNPAPYDGPLEIIGEIGMWAPEPSGEHCFKVACGQSGVEFGSADMPAIPADFFEPGSEPFDGVVNFNSQGQLDTLILRREDPFDRAELPSPREVTVEIELVQLRLVSCAPISVQTNDVVVDWTMEMDLSEIPAPPGSLTATKEHTNGGTFQAEFAVQPRFIFTKADEPSEVRILDTAEQGIPPIQFRTIEETPWVHDLDPELDVSPCDGNGFEVAAPVRTSSEEGTILILDPPRPTSPYFALDNEQQWTTALEFTPGAVVFAGQPVDFSGTEAQWLATSHREGPPYPDSTFIVPELYVWPGSDCVCPNDPWPSAPGLVMALGTGDEPEGSYTSLWVYKYPTDPDLSNATITITVLPPPSVNVISFAMRDINGNIRGWYWNVSPPGPPVPGMLPSGVPTAVNINTSLTGIAAASPTATSYTSNPAFDITKVQDFLVDENWNWVGGPQNVPPPGQTVPRMWNYWYDLIVTPNTQVKPTDPVKWSQPPVECAPHTFLGWDELSIRDIPPLMADDWLCTDKRPVTDIHWWGSFIDWDEPELPPQIPVAFHFGIWTDVPKDPNKWDSFSHPDEMVWEYVCSNYQWNFAGFDKDPRITAPTLDPSGVTLANNSDAIFQPVVHDSCFQFYCKLPENDWFYQEPGPCGKNVYWLSIAAIYDPTSGDPQFPWGWKTRPKYFNDDAIRIFELESGLWPASVGSKYGAGRPVEYPQWVSWDLAFELTTNRECPPAPLEADFDLSGTVNFIDFAFFASQWLATWP
ncbi:MAG: DUF7901 domain-containing protein [Planctomycetota bacterium]|jgi:hypothetical protein